MLNLKSLKLKITVEIKPKNMNNIEGGVKTYLYNFLLKYSYKFKCIPLTFAIDGIVKKGLVREDGSLNVTTLINFVVFKLEIGSTLHAVNGSFMGAFFAFVDNDENFTGDFKVTDIQDTDDTFKIIGVSV